MDLVSGLLTDLSVMSAATCAALAQVIPVFLIALIAERFVAPKDRKSVPRVIASILFSVFLAITIAVLEIAMLLGIEIGGYEGRNAVGYWLITVAVILAVLYRWLLGTAGAALIPVFHKRIQKWLKKLKKRRKARAIARSQQTTS